jgi:hypothetical protein
MGKHRRGLEPRQAQGGAQPAERALLELERAAIGGGDVDDDRQAEARAGPRFVEPAAAL